MAGNLLKTMSLMMFFITAIWLTSILKTFTEYAIIPSLILSVMIWLPAYAFGHMVSTVDEIKEDIEEIKENSENNSVTIEDKDTFHQIKMDVEEIKKELKEKK